MKDLKAINKERERRINLSQYKDLIEKVSKTEFAKFSNLGLIEYSEVVNLAYYTIYYLINSGNDYNEAYLIKATKWAIRNEMRRRFKWHTMRDTKAEEIEMVKDAVYKTILSIDELAEAENPVHIKDSSRTPDEKAEIYELKNRICEIMKKLPQREQDLIEAKYFYDKKLKDIAEEFNISQSRISRIIQNGLDKIKKELLKQESLDENNISEK